MKKFNIVHIHTDYKFVHSTRRFEGDFFLNTAIVIQSKIPYPKKPNEDVLLFKNNKRDRKQIIDICSGSDLVVLYGLTDVKVKIALAIPENIKIAWRFFGYELYKSRPDLFKSDLSRKYSVKKFNLIEVVKENIYSLSTFLMYGKTNSELFKSTLTRIDYMLCLSYEEYQFLEKIWPGLPRFIKLSHPNQGNLLGSIKFDNKNIEEKPIIILGNNRSPYNNHLDLIELIDQHEAKVNYEFVLLFNYGTKSIYTEMVMDQIAGKAHYTNISDFIPKDEFFEFYRKPTALIINGYRQMAGFNIFLALANGTKVYLNDKNVHKKWLTNEGFRIFSIEDFENDLKSDNIKFDLEIASYNFHNLKEFSRRYTNEDFQKEVLKVLKYN